jgi:hypothetical protein
VYASPATGRVDDLGSPITNTADAYESTLKLQNYKTEHIAPPSEGWGLGYTTDDLSGVIDQALTTRNIPLSWQPDDVSSKKIKRELLKYTTGIGMIDSSGLESWRDPLAMYEDTGFLFTNFHIKEKDLKPVSISDNKIFCEIGVTYANGTISVTNVEQENYSSEYVIGVTDPDDRQALWFAGRLLYQRYGIKNKFRQSLGDIKGISDEVDAVDYIKRQYSLAGVVFGSEIVSLYSRYTVKFTVNTEVVWQAIAATGSFEIGSPLKLTYPSVAQADTGIVTGITPNIDGGETAISAEMVGVILDTQEEVIIQEAGDAPDEKQEQGDASDIVQEVL